MKTACGHLGTTIKELHKRQTVGHFVTKMLYQDKAYILFVDYGTKDEIHSLNH